MSNSNVVKTFLTHYQNQEYEGMKNCLAERVKFSDYAFKEIEGKQVKAMWNWFCKRKDPIKVSDISIIEETGNTVVAKYRIQYLYEGKKNVDYYIKSTFTFDKDGKIISQKDEFFSISDFEFAMMLKGLPTALLAYTPLMQILVRNTMGKKLSEAMQNLKD